MRYHYMDSVTRLVRANFSNQVGAWCRKHGVQYIGHLIEDDNAHARTGASLGHYFRGLDGQDMSGIDDIGGQVLPQGEDEPHVGNMGATRDGEFYHYMLGSLAASAAAIEPGKQGRAMCEIFGNYGWAEGVQLEKYLAEHFMVRGVNHFVPHAFSPKAFPDMDCPPHFYAHGNNPQYRHFGELVRYMNRVCTLISDGKRMADVAVLYHAEAEWSGDAMLTQKPARKLMEAQIDFLCVPVDVFAEPEHYGTKLSDGLSVNGIPFRALVIPYAQYLTGVAVAAVAELLRQGFPVLFVDGLPRGICDRKESLPREITSCAPTALDGLVAALGDLGIHGIVAAPKSTYLRVLHYQNGQDLYYFVNEGDRTYHGTAEVETRGDCYVYDAWENCCRAAKTAPCGRGTAITLDLEPRKGLLVLFGEAPEKLALAPDFAGERTELSEWERSLCESLNYPSFGEAKRVSLPDSVETEYPEFSGFVRYKTTFQSQGGAALLEITDAAEGVEVFLNGHSLGIQIVPTYRYDLGPCLRDGENELVVEVATTLERKCYGFMKDDPRAKMRGLTEPTAKSGLCGRVYLRKAEKWNQS